MRKPNEKCYSLDEETFYDWEQLIRELEENDDLQEGVTYYEADKVHIKADEYINAIDILEELDERIYEDIGEVYDYEFSNASSESKKELEEIIAVWAEKHVNLPYWKAINVVQKRITKQDME